MMDFPDLPEFLVLRHGETEWNVQKRMQGHLDSPLTHKGRAQAQKQGDLLRDIELSTFQIFASPQGRVQTTAQIALAQTGLTAIRDERLMEIEMGTWQGMTQAEMLAEVGHPPWINEPFAVYAHAPEGEGFAAFGARCAEFLASLSGPSVVFTHGMTSRMLRLLALGYDALDQEQMEALPGGQGVIYRIKDGIQTRLGTL